jgi:hypothetical protein
MENRKTREQWVKPFSSQISCIDTVDAVCARGLSVDECKKKCNDSKYCLQGYHVKLPNDKESYCLALNNTQTTINLKSFENSFFNPLESPFITPELGVKINTFQTDKFENLKSKLPQFPKNAITQKAYYYLTYRKNNQLYYFTKYQSFSTDINKALDFNITKRFYSYSSISIAKPGIQNGSYVFLIINESNGVFHYSKKNDSYLFELPLSLDVLSTNYFIDNREYNQLITSYPFDYNYICEGDLFSIRTSITNLTEKDVVVYATIKNNKMAPETVSVKNMKVDFDNKYKIFEWVRSSKKVDTEDTFLSSQKT